MAVPSRRFLGTGRDRFTMKRVISPEIPVNTAIIDQSTSVYANISLISFFRFDILFRFDITELDTSLYNKQSGIFIFKIFIVRKTTIFARLRTRGVTHIFFRLINIEEVFFAYHEALYAFRTVILREHQPHSCAPTFGSRFTRGFGVKDALS